MVKEITNYLWELGFTKNETKVYLALAKLGEAKAAQIAKAADLPRTTTISLLSKLAEANYLTTHSYKGVTSYWIESPQVLRDLLSSKMIIAEKLQEALPQLYRADGHFPQAKVFDTKKAIKNFIEKTISGLAKGDIIYTIDTPHEGNYSKIFSAETENLIFSGKQKKGLVTKTLVPAGSYRGIAKDKLSVQPIIIRELPAAVNFQGSLWLIKDMLINFSGNPPFLVMTKHNALVSGMKALYDFLWSISSPTPDLRLK
jgi:predicted transcriptional regulator